MFSEEEQKEFNNQFRVSLYYWFTSFLMILLIGLCPYFLSLKGFEPRTLTGLNIDYLRTTLLALSGVALYIAYFLRLITLKGNKIIVASANQSSPVKTAAKRYLGAMLIIVGISELVAGFGLFLYLYEMDLKSFMYFLLPASFTLIYFRPRKKEMKEYIIDRTTAPEASPESD